MNQVIPKSLFLSRLNRFLVFAIIVTAAGHFLVVNALSVQGFIFKDLKSKANDLVAEEQTMESTVSSLGSYQNLNPRIQSLKLVAADGVNYVSWDQHVVAKK